MEKPDYILVAAATRAFVHLYDEGGLQSTRLAIAHEIEGSLLDIADTQVQSAERGSDSSQKQLQLAIAAFLDLRHTTATLLLTQGVHPRVVMETLGHSQISLTLDTYSHCVAGATGRGRAPDARGARREWRSEWLSNRDERLG